MSFRRTPPLTSPAVVVAESLTPGQFLALDRRCLTGIGLFRTEMLFMDRSTPPEEDEQAEVYIAAVKAARGRPVTFRTFDVGGDKMVSYLNFSAEANPFLGRRGARLERAADDHEILAVLNEAL